MSWQAIWLVFGKSVEYVDLSLRFSVVKVLSVSVNLGLLGCVLCWAARAVGLEAGSPAEKDLQEEYVIDGWQTEDGLPDNFINDVARTPDGYLWVATFNGLARFNGVEFATFDPANAPQLESRRVTNLLLDAKGRLWIAGEEGSEACWLDGSFEDFTRKEWPARTGRYIRDGSDGALWLSPEWSATEFYRLTAKGFEKVAGERSFDRMFGHVSDAAGRGWDVFSNCLCCLDPKSPVVSAIPGGVNSGWRLAASRDGGIWVISRHIWKYRDGQWQDFGPTSTDLFNGYFEDRRGNLWVGTDEGQVWRISTNGWFQRFRLRGVKTTQLGRGFCEDAEGNIWLGTGGSGLFRLKPRMFEVYSSQDGLASDVVRSVTQDRAGRVWFATVNRLDRLKAPEAKRAKASGLGVVLPWEVLGAKDGSLLIGTFGEGLYRAEADGALKRFTGPTETSPPINAVFEEQDGTVDLGTPRGLWRWRTNSIAPVEMPSWEGRMDVRALAQDTRGNLYLGLESGGLARRTPTGWERFSTEEGLAEKQVRSLWIDSEDILWIGEQRSGLSRFDGKRFFNYTNAIGAPAFDLPATVTALIGDDEGYLWLASNRGLHRASLKQLDDVAEGRQASASVIHFDRSDGMGSSECIDDHQPSVWKTTDGRLWFATTFGVSVVDPAALPLNPRPPPVRIEAALIDDRPVWPQPSKAPGGGELRVPPDYARLEFHFTALSLTAPARNRYRFQLAPFEKNWEEAGARRTAYYKRVPPGHYEFKVTGCNNDGVWNETGASLALVIVPPWWETAGFRWAAAAACGLLIFAAYHWRVESLKSRTAAQQEISRRLIESQELERQRIAGELHDGLGQSLLVIKSRALLALRDPDLPAGAREELDALTSMAGHAIGEARQIAHNLRPFQLDELGLTRALRGMINNVSRASGISIKHEVADVDGAFAHEQEINIYRIVQELLNNVMKHAQASEVGVSVERDQSCVRVTVRDNGRGFGPEKPSGEGFGMRAISERVRILGGSWTMQSAPGEGTVAVVTLPVAAGGAQAEGRATT